MSCLVSVVIPAYDAAETLPRVLDALAAERPGVDEVIVVDDGSTDGTAQIAYGRGARVVAPPSRGYAGGARNGGWEAASGDVVVFLDADMVPQPGFVAAVRRAVAEHPGALIGGARMTNPTTAWAWVAHLQTETPYLPRGGVRDAGFLPSGCLIVPRDLSLRFDASYGGEDGLFCADAARSGRRLVFDPRIVGLHLHGRETLADLRRHQTRLAYGLARCADVQCEGRHKRFFHRVPVHYFLFGRLAVIYRRLDEHPGHRRRFWRHLPRLAFAEWSLGVAHVRYAVRRPRLRGQDGPGFRSVPSAQSR